MQVGYRPAHFVLYTFLCCQAWERKLSWRFLSHPAAGFLRDGSLQRKEFMRKNFIFGFSILVIVLGFSFVVRNPKNNVEISDRRITFIAPIANNGYWGQAAIAIQESGRELGIDVKCVGFVQENQESLINYMESAVLSKVDGIITVGLLYSKEFNRVVQEAKEQGIPVVFIDCDVKDSERLCYIGVDNYVSGGEAAHQLAQLCEERGKVAVIVCNKKKLNQKERLSGFEDVILTYPDMEITEVLDWENNVLLLKKEIMEMLERNPEITAVFCAEGYSSRALSQVLVDLPEKYSHLKTVVFDLNDDTEKAIREGLLDRIIEQNPRVMGEKAVEALACYLDGDRSRIQDHIIQAQIISQQNIDQGEGYVNGEAIWHVY